MKILFIHRSVGRDLIEQGKLRELLHSKNILLDDYDNNTDILTHDSGKALKSAITMPGNNTNPDNLAEFFGEWPDVLDGYDLIMIKSCYPNSHIKDKDQLDKVMSNYSSIIESFISRNRCLLILTSPPLRPLLTNKTEARLSSELADWLVSLSKDNIQVYDLHYILSESEGKYEGMLRREYRRLLPFDNHPNRKAHESVAPLIAKKIERTSDNGY